MRGPFDFNAQRICDKARTMRNTGWLSDVKLEVMQRRDKMENEDNGE